METHSQPNNSVDGKKLLDAQLRESFGRVTYSHKAHEKEADILSAKLSKLKLGQIILPAISTAGFVTALFGSGWVGSLVGTGCSAVLLALSLYTKNYDLGRQAQGHRDVANDLWFIREKYLSLITDLAIGLLPLSDLQSKRDALTYDLQVVYSKSPNTTEGAYRKARKALKVDEEMTFTSPEVDAFLPEELRRGS